MANALWLPSRAARSLLPLLAAASLAQAPVRVAYLHQGLPVGGVESSLINVCRFIDRRRIEPVLVLFGRDAADALLDDALRAGCAVERFDARWRNADWSISWDERQVQRLTRYLLDAPTRSHFGPREETLEKKGYWTGAVEIVDLDLSRVAEAVRRALAARARRKAAS